MVELTRRFPHELDSVDDLDIAGPRGSVQHADSLDGYTAEQRVLLLEAIEIPVQWSVVDVRRGHSRRGRGDKCQDHQLVVHLHHQTISRPMSLSLSLSHWFEEDRSSENFRSKV